MECRIDHSPSAKKSLAIFAATVAAESKVFHTLPSAARFQQGDDPQTSLYFEKSRAGPLYGIRLAAAFPETSLTSTILDASESYVAGRKRTQVSAHFRIHQQTLTPPSHSNTNAFHLDERTLNICCATALPAVLILPSMCSPLGPYLFQPRVATLNLTGGLPPSHPPTQTSVFPNLSQGVSLLTTPRVWPKITNIAY